MCASSAANHDRPAHGKGFEGRGQQHPALRLYAQIAGSDEVVDHGVQDLVDVAMQGQEAGFLKALDDIISACRSQERWLSSGVFSETAWSFTSFAVSMAMEVSSSSLPFFGVL